MQLYTFLRVLNRHKPDDHDDDDDDDDDDTLGSKRVAIKITKIKLC